MVLVALLAYFLGFGVPILAVLALAAVLAKVAPQYRPAKGEIVDRES
jgi:cytochrome c biogenesis protein CcdA